MLECRSNLRRAWTLDLEILNLAQASGKPQEGVISTTFLTTWEASKILQQQDKLKIKQLQLKIDSFFNTKIYQ